MSSIPPPAVPVISLDLEYKISIWRKKTADSTITLEEMKEAIIALRAGRLSAAEASAKSGAAGGKARAKKAPVNAQSILDGL